MPVLQDILRLWANPDNRRRRPAVSTEHHNVELPGLGCVMVSRTIDCIGEGCPRPQLLTLKAFNQIGQGDIVEFISDNPATVETVLDMMFTLPGSHLATVRTEGRWHVYLRKGHDQP